LAGVCGPCLAHAHVRRPRGQGHRPARGRVPPRAVRRPDREDGRGVRRRGGARPAAPRARARAARGANAAQVPRQGPGRRGGRPGRATSLSPPWDLTILDGTLYVAMAGTHQLWAMRLGSGEIRPHTGTGREALEDGPRETAAMNQPSGLATDGRLLYVADSEASAVRAVEPGPGGAIRTIVGEGLFEFGDADGIGPASVRLQHPLGIAWHGDVLFVADTYNHKIKRLDPRTGECRTLLGAGAPGHADGAAGAAR